MDADLAGKAVDKTKFIGLIGSLSYLIANSLTLCLLFSYVNCFNLIQNNHISQLSNES